MKHFSVQTERNNFSIKLLAEEQGEENRFTSCDRIVVSRWRGPKLAEEAVHPFSVKVVLTGEEVCTVGKQVTRLRPGSVLMIPSGARLSSQMVGQSTSVTISFPTSIALAELMSQPGFRERSNSNRPPDQLLRDFPMHTRKLPSGWEQIFRAIYDAPSDGDLLGTPLSVLSESVKLAVEANEEIARIPAVKNSARHELFRRVCLGRTAIEETPGLHLDQLAEACCLSPFHLHRVFTAAFQITPGCYAKHRKMDISKKLLEGTKMPVKAVAYQAGFGNPSAFVRSFRNVCGVTPMNFRKASRAA